MDDDLPFIDEHRQRCEATAEATWAALLAVLVRGLGGRVPLAWLLGCEPSAGKLFLLLTPDELLARLATLVPPPRIHSVRYHGVFAPNSKARQRVVPLPQVAAAAPLPPATPDPVPGAASIAPAAKPPRTPATYRLPWADLLEKAFAVDVLSCPACGGRLQLIAFIAEALVAKRILDHLALDAAGPPLSRARAPPELFDPRPSYHAADPAYPADP